MPRTPAEAFEMFLSRLTPTEAESDAAKAHRQSIRGCIAENFGLLAFFRTGSFGNGTSVSGFSEADYFAVLPGDRLLQNSESAIAQLAAALYRRFPETGVVSDSPAVRVPFAEGSEATEIVPADYRGENSSGDRIFRIPNRRGGWMMSSPEAYHRRIRELDESQGGRVRSLIRIVKAWKYFNRLPVSSFFLQVAVAAYSASRGIVPNMENDVAMAFRYLKTSELLKGVPDPTGVSEPIRGVASAKEFWVSEAALDRAVKLVHIARAFMALKQPAKAVNAWGTLFAGKFPAG